jgi:gliding motility-associated-like protein
LPSTGLNNASFASPVATIGQTTTYVVTATAGVCSLTDAVTITVYPIPVVNAGQDITVIKGDDAQMGGQISNAVNFIWSPTTYLNSASILNPISVRPQATTTYRLTATNEVGCSSFDDVVVTVLPYCIKVKNAFTPNGDGVNDNWMVYDQFDCLKNVKVSVYNRYGSKVFESRNYRNEWKGTFDGKSLPDATYYYLIDFELTSGRVLQLRGDVTILR